jgi:hypothetical protein
MTEGKSTSKWHGGKGSAVRKTSDQTKYADNYDRIFGNKSKVDSDATSVYDDARLSTQTDEEAWGKNDKS